MNLTQEKGRTFAEVKPKNIRKLYVPKMDSDLREKIEKIVKALINESIDYEEGIREIDNIIYEFYGLDSNQILIIEGKE